MKNRTRTPKTPPVSPLWRLTAEKPCMAAGCRGKKSAARPHALLCDRHGHEWAERTGRYEGLTEEQRQELEAVWIRVANEWATPETVTQARAHARRQLGCLTKGADGSPKWRRAAHFAAPARRAA